MKPETAQTVGVVVAIIGVGIALATLILSGQEALRDQIDGLREDMREDISDVRGDISNQGERLRGAISKVSRDVSDLRDDMANLDVRVGRLEGLLKGLGGPDQTAEIHETLESVAAADGSAREGADGLDMEEFSGGATRPSGIPDTRQGGFRPPSSDFNANR